MGVILLDHPNYKLQRHLLVLGGDVNGYPMLVDEGRFFIGIKRDTFDTIVVPDTLSNFLKRVKFRVLRTIVATLEAGSTAQLTAVENMSK